MLTKIQVNEIREHLEKAQNPIFFFDNDPDGLCSFLLLQRYIGRGKGVPIKSFPKLVKDYFRRVKELNADYIFILDKPEVSEDFWKEVGQINIPVVWIDHHPIDKESIPKFVNYYNPFFNKPSKTEPVTYLCYQVAQKKEDLWLAVVGCIADRFLPDFYSEFQKLYPDLTIKSKDPFEIFYESEIGKIAKIFTSALKDRITSVINMLKFLMKVKNPYEVLEESKKNLSMHQRFQEINRKHQKFLNKAKLVAYGSKKILYFRYGGDLSISSDLANELSYLFPEKIVVVVYVTEVKANISARGKDIREVIAKAIENLELATSGGHKDAVGAQVLIDDVDKFKENLFELIRKE